MRIGQHLLGWRLGFLAVVLAAIAAGASSGDSGGDADWSAVFTLTNDPEGNELAIYSRDGRGRLSDVEFCPTGGDGTGGGLGNQGALAMSDNRNFLYAVNPGSDSITVFRLGRRGPQVLQVIDSGGKRPISLTVHKDLLYVLNAGGAVGEADGIAGFEIRNNGRLRSLKGSVRLLSGANTGPAQIEFDPRGNSLVVTEKGTNTIGAFAIGKNGLPVDGTFIASAGETPFGFAFSRDGFLIVSEAFGGAPDGSSVSSYWFDGREGTFDIISKSVPTKQTAACWIANTRNGEYSYATNTGSDTITGYKIEKKGKLARLDDDGITAETGTAPTDLAILGNRALFVLNRNDGTVGVYTIKDGGGLSPLQLVGGLPLTNPTGLVVR